MDAVFGELPLAAKFLIAFVIVLGLIGSVFYLVRRFGSSALGSSASRGRQPRLSVIEAAPVDSRRRLVLVRRDNVEHLIMLGGPTDVVVESNIVRAAPIPAAREVPPPRMADITEASPRAMPLVEGMAWPPAPEPGLRPQRLAVPDRSAAYEESPLQPQPEPAPRAHAAERLSGLAADLSRPAGRSEAPASRTLPAQEAKRATAPPLGGAHTDDKTFSAIATRLEAALRRPVAPREAAPGETTAKHVTEPLVRSPVASDLTGPFAARRTAGDTSRPPAVEPKEQSQSSPSEPTPHAARNAETSESSRSPPLEPKEPSRSPGGEPIYDSLEQEMASLLGRPTGKT
jgi:flagellar biogenesis protein FliO